LRNTKFYEGAHKKSIVISLRHQYDRFGYHFQMLSPVIECSKGSASES